MLRTAITAVLIASPAIAEPGQHMRQAVEEALIHYAENAGVLSACGEGPGLQSVRRYAGQIAKWGEPSFTDWLSGARSNYASNLTQRGESAYNLAAAEGCPNMTMSQQIAVETMAETIERETR